MKFHASNLQLSTRGGEYFQVAFEESEAEGASYVLVQNAFEFGRGPAYFECHDHDLSGHGVVRRCKLQRASLEIGVEDSDTPILVTFDAPKTKVGNLAWLLRIIFAERVSFVNSSGVEEIPMEEQD
jgi:hypothetical protein